MIGLDTHILARYYIEDQVDTESAKQREAARRLVEAGSPLMVCKTVLLEFEWVLRGYYEFERAAILKVFRHLYALPHVTIEDRVTVEQALANYASGLDFADALHHAAYRQCESMASFDDKEFRKRAQRLGLTPVIVVAK